ncbi:MAG: hypothetical protein IKN13_03960 [Bacteroidales bacterium]|nr:hypothetical protein [Bacteroidales bacterium]
MKLTFKTVIVAAMALAVATACSKETSAPGKEEGKEPEVVPAETVVLKFTANSEAVKTTLDGNTPTWEDGDEVKVTYVSEGETKTVKTVAAVSEGVATFTVEVASDVTDLYFSYPYNVNATLADGGLSIAVPAEQDGDFAKANIALAKASKDDDVLNFFNAVSLAKIQILDSEVTALKISSNTEGENLVGTKTFTVTAGGITPAETVESGNSELVVNVNGAGVYYAAVLPGARISAGVTIRSMHGSSVAGSVVTTSAFDFVRATIYDFGTEEKLNHRYVSADADGNGHGLTADSPWNTAQLAAFLGNAGNSDGFEEITVFLAEGNYTPDPIEIKLADVVLNIEGIGDVAINGSNHRIFTVSSDLDLNIKNVAFSGASSEGDGSALYIADASVSLTGCTFENNSADRGGAVAIEKGELAFEDCILSENTASHGNRESIDTNSDELRTSNQTAAGGAVIATGAATVSFSNCLISGNTATNGLGGAIATADTGATIVIDNGTVLSENSSYGAGGAIFSWGGFRITGTEDERIEFSGNKTLATANQCSNGGAIWLNEKTTSTMSYVLFTGNEAGQPGSTMYYSNGGAISMNGVTSFVADHCEFTASLGRNGGALNLELGHGECKFIDCNFHDNICKKGTDGNFHGAAARLSYGPVDFENCTFINNTAYNGSGAIHINNNASAVARFKNCLFDGNYTENGKGGALAAEYGSVYMDGCTIKNCYTKGTASDNALNGGAIWIDKNATKIEARNCQFLGNKTNGTKTFGGVMRIEAAQSAYFENCLFDGNVSANRGGIFGLNLNAELKMNHCIIKNTTQASGGAIQVGKDCLVYLNDVAFYNNVNTASGGWGVNIHSGDANICMNNVTSNGNRTTNSNPGNNISFNSDGGWIIINSTIVDEMATAIVRANGTKKAVVCNNILFNNKTADNMFVLKTAGNFVDKGHNLMSCENAPDGLTIASTTLLGQSESTIDGGVYVDNTETVPYYGVYMWDNTLAGFTPATKDEIKGVLNSDYNVKDNIRTSITNIGQDFCNWLEEIGALDTDGRGVTRSGDFWPGAYQD